MSVPRAWPSVEGPTPQRRPLLMEALAAQLQTKPSEHTMPDTLRLPHTVREHRRDARARSVQLNLPQLRRNNPPASRSGVGERHTNGPMQRRLLRVTTLWRGPKGTRWGQALRGILRVIAHQFAIERPEHPSFAMTNTQALIRLGPHCHRRPEWGSIDAVVSECFGSAPWSGHGAIGRTVLRPTPAPY